MPVIRSKKAKRERLSAIIAALAEIYPDAPCALEYGSDPWRLLVMARLSAQCTDARVNVVSRELFAKYPDPHSMANAPLSDIERIVKPCGLYRMKADSIKAASAIIDGKYGGRVPSTMDELLELPGVGRKIANLVLGDVYGEGAIVCDTHFMRILGRLGFYKEDLRDATKIEFMIRELMDDISLGSDFCHRIVIFGREICGARNPACDVCPISHLCEKYISSGKAVR